MTGTTWRPWRAAAVIVLLGWLAGCGSKGPKPAELVQFKPTAQLRVDWHASVGDSGRYIFTPAVRDGAVYAAASTGELVRLDAKTGKVAWRVNTKMPLSGGVGAGENLVLVGSSKGVVLAYDQGGKPLWQSTVSSEVLSSPQASGEFVVVRSGDSRIFGLDARDGSRRWEYQTATPPLTLRANPGVGIVDTFVIAGMPAGKLIVLNLANGGLVWETVVAAPKGDNELERITDIAGQPLIEKNRVCAVTYQGRAACYETEKGSQVWARPASSAGRLAVDDLSVYISEEVGAVVALDKNSGASVWKQDRLGYRNLSSPVVLGNYIVVGDFEGQVHFLKFEDGDFAARMPTDGSAISATPRAMDDKVLIQTRKGGLYAMSLRQDAGK
ncbi:MAG TPA: outer membrane protein assembly factor BamB [Burkholderiales bacterium]|nr:outer membrane protein assembly factor BamB [Burkholderiales bacterium]